MRTVALALLLGACTGTPASPGPTASERLSWLVGTWQQVDGEATFVERWSADPRGDLLGSGYVRIGPKVLGFTETLAVSTLPDGQLVWTAWPMDQEPASFRVTLEGTDALLAQRDGEGFPQRLRYQRAEAEGVAQLSVTATGPGPQGSERSETMTLSALGKHTPAP